MGDLCRENHMPEVYSMFKELSPRDQLAVIQRKQLCHFCFRHSDGQPCPSHSMLACPVRGCMRMHYRLLHDALQGAKVIEVEEELQGRMRSSTQLILRSWARATVMRRKEKSQRGRHSPRLTWRMTGLAFANRGYHWK